MRGKVINLYEQRELRKKEFNIEDSIAAEYALPDGLLIGSPYEGTEPRFSSSNNNGELYAPRGPSRRTTYCGMESHRASRRENP